MFCNATSSSILTTYQPRKEVTMELGALAILVMVLLLDWAALRWGVDSRDGRDWQPRSR